MAINRGKQFEKVIQAGFKQLPYVAIDRINDATGGYMGIKSYCDYIIYRRPYAYYIECKAISGNTLNFQSHISETQWNGLYTRSLVDGAIAGILVWFTEHDKTYFVDIRVLHELRDRNYRSLNIKDLPFKGLKTLELRGVKKRVLFNYHLVEFLRDMEAMYDGN